MQKLLIFILLMVSLTTFSQTTLEEYNYITTGYKIQLESGLDMKKGYLLAKGGVTKTEERTATLYSFTKKTANPNELKLVAYMIEYERKGKPKEYYCIPHPFSDKQIQSLYFESLNTNNNDTAPKLLLFVSLLSSGIEWINY